MLLQQVSCVLHAVPCQSGGKGHGASALHLGHHVPWQKVLTCSRCQPPDWQPHWHTCAAGVQRLKGLQLSSRTWEAASCTASEPSVNEVQLDMDCQDGLTLQEGLQWRRQHQE